MVIAFAPDALIGHEVLGTYRLVEHLGTGGMSVVYRGRHMLTDQDVAVKVLPPELARHADVKTRFIEEARTLARLEHPNIVLLHNFVEDEGNLYLVMQFANGETFDARIEREGRVCLRDGVTIGIEVLKALEYAHGQGVVHRDIKPGNIILRLDGQVKVMDFGIAKIVGSRKLTHTGQTMGTVTYMSPEQVRGKGIDHRSDLYSLGVTLYEAITGRLLFSGETHFDVMRKHVGEAPTRPSAFVALSATLEKALLKALAKNPGDRFDDAVVNGRVRTPGRVDDHAGAEQEAFFGFLLVVPGAHLGADDFRLVRLWVEFFPVGEWLGATAGAKHVG